MTEVFDNFTPVVKTPNPAIPAAVEQVVREYGFREVIHTVAGSTISCHCGPNTLGILFLRA